MTAVGEILVVLFGGLCVLLLHHFTREWSDASMRTLDGPQTKRRPEGRDTAPRPQRHTVLLT
jgi:hypothetical protein